MNKLFLIHLTLYASIFMYLVPAETPNVLSLFTFSPQDEQYATQLLKEIITSLPTNLANRNSLEEKSAQGVQSFLYDPVAQKIAHTMLPTIRSENVQEKDNGLFDRLYKQHLDETGITTENEAWLKKLKSHPPRSIERYMYEYNKTLGILNKSNCCFATQVIIYTELTKAERTNKK